ncbi:Y-family DNA polymerase [Bosea sp. BK604]|uniref:Y-family DNA polymerase n=1 Tax=Bosea sp. BK604 TaxID=2512180 RepID=UPI001045329E|nr:Y-family DNA polymerase [Bosea sp. BK604]TCR64714.1 DNA polymerase V [Bosea sp. BK604]
MSRSFALIDGNSFYCSCERLFDPKLRRRPVIVLSNNDGCAVSRTAEAKALGVRMATPMFMIRDLVRREGIAVFSSNYALYGDISRRMNEVYQRFAPDIEIYSIDESFLDVTDIEPEQREEFGRDLRSTVSTWTGIPTCVGIGPTKTLAKLANHIAKTTPQLGGVCDLTSASVRKEWLPAIALGEVWGIGRSSQAKLAALGCRTVADVAALDPRPVRKAMTVVGERIIHELRGTPCLDLESVTPTRKGCAVTRCFSGRVDELEVLLEAVASHATRLGEKLRQHGLATDHVTVFYHTSEHDRGEPQRSVSFTVDLPEASNDSLVLVRAARWGAKRIWKAGYRYSKAGLVTVDLVPPEASQRALIGAFDRDASGRLMAALDACNKRFGRGSVFPASTGIERQRQRWQTKFEMRTPRYTTRIEEVPIVLARA